MVGGVETSSNARPSLLETLPVWSNTQLRVSAQAFSGKLNPENSVKNPFVKLFSTLAPEALAI